MAKVFLTIIIFIGVALVVYYLFLKDCFNGDNFKFLKNKKEKGESGQEIESSDAGEREAAQSQDKIEDCNCDENADYIENENDTVEEDVDEYKDNMETGEENKDDFVCESGYF